MKVQVVVTDDKGNVFEGEVTLTATSGASRAKDPSGRKPRKQQPRRVELDFSLPVRPLMNLHAKGLSGSAKFTVLLAALTKGRLGEAKSLKEIENAWNRMTELMGGSFNPAHTTRAKNAGWVDTAKPGFYVLLARWPQALDRR